MKSTTVGSACCFALLAGLVIGCGESPPPVVEAPPEPAPAPAPPPPPAAKPIQLAELKPLTLEAGASATVALQVTRNENAGPIQVRVEGAPEGLTVKAAEIPDGQSAGQLEVKAAPTLGDTALAAKLAVHVKVGEQAATGTLAVNVPELGLPTFRPVSQILMQPGNTKKVDIKIERQRYKGPVELRVENAPAKLACKVAKIDEGKDSATLELAAAADAPNVSQAIRVSTSLFGRTLSAEVPVKIESQPFQVKTFRVVTLAPGDTQFIEVPVTRSSYKGPLQVKPDALPPGVTIKSAAIAPDQTKARVEVSVAADAAQRVHSTKMVTTGGDLSSSDSIVLRIAGADETYLPPAIVANPEIIPLLRRGSIGGRLTAESKQALSDFYGGTPEAHATVMRGLKWLAAHQQPDGSWGLKDYGKGIEGCDCQGDFEKEAQDCRTAGTAFGILPFLGEGVTHNRAPEQPPELAKYQRLVERGLIFLAQHQIRSKDDKKDGYLGGSMYAHALGTIALCEAYGLSQDERLKVNAQLAIKYLLNAQHEKGGGWRYSPGTPGDMSVTGWVFLAIRSAQLTGIDVLKPPLVRAGRFVDSCAVGPSEAKNSRYAYTPGTAEKLSLSAAGLLTRQYLGWKKDEPDLLAGAKYLMENLPPESGGNLGPIYYYYYATQVLHHMEGPNFDLWNHRMREHLIRTQEKTGHKTGSWNPQGTDWGARGGRMYSTAMALLTLQVYYRHLPMYRFVKLGG
ncbi:MAG: terpene cyclase/mutase family protein [Candidatus Anammoximicrobium sp.]|nr:terpene cyclase/mutase family protein [Candidatus Anammoximicrobium sp.]